MLALRDVSIRLQGETLIAPFSLNVGPGETLMIMGPSGSGKSSLLSFIGGDLDPVFEATGEVLLAGMALNEIPASRRCVARLFQDDLLFPHMTVAENLLFAIPRLPQPQRVEMMRQALREAELDGFEDRPPHTLSGGQRARVALMRALLARPKAILLDEPFGKLDRELRASIRAFTFSHIATRRIPAMLVSHDPEDAPPGGRILTITAGRLAGA